MGIKFGIIREIIMEVFNDNNEIKKRLNKGFLLCHDIYELLYKLRDKLNHEKFKELLKDTNEKELYFRSFLVVET